MPWKAVDKDEILKQNIECNIEIPNEGLLNKITVSAQDIMKKMLEKNPEERYSA